jgi:hypothetical protein
VFDFGLPDLDDDGRVNSFRRLRQVVVAEKAQRLRYGFVKGLRRHLDGMLDALRVPADDLACSERHLSNIASSSFVR